MDWTYEDALREMHECRYGKEIARMYEDGFKKEVVRRIEEQAIVTPEEVRTAARNDAMIRKDIREHGLNADLPPSVVRMYKEYREQQIDAELEEYRAMLRQKQDMEARLRLQAEGFRDMERKGFSVHNELMRRG